MPNKNIKFGIFDAKSNRNVVLTNDYKDFKKRLNKILSLLIDRLQKRKNDPSKK